MKCSIDGCDESVQTVHGKYCSDNCKRLAAALRAKKYRSSTKYKLYRNKKYVSRKCKSPSCKNTAGKRKLYCDICGEKKLRGRIRTAKSRKKNPSKTKEMYRKHQRTYYYKHYYNNPEKTRSRYKKRKESGKAMEHERRRLEKRRNLKIWASLRQLVKAIQNATEQQTTEISG